MLSLAAAAAAAAVDLDVDGIDRITTSDGRDMAKIMENRTNIERNNKDITLLIAILSLSLSLSINSLSFNLSILNLFLVRSETNFNENRSK